MANFNDDINKDNDDISDHLESDSKSPNELNDVLPDDVLDINNEDELPDWLKGTQSDKDANIDDILNDASEDILGQALDISLDKTEHGEDSPSNIINQEIDNTELADEEIPNWLTGSLEDTISLNDTQPIVLGSLDDPVILSTDEGELDSEALPDWLVNLAGESDDELTIPVDSSDQVREEILDKVILDEMDIEVLLPPDKSDDVGSTVSDIEDELETILIPSIEETEEDIRDDETSEEILEILEDITTEDEFAESITATFDEVFKDEKIEESEDELILTIEDNQLAEKVSVDSAEDLPEGFVHAIEDTSELIESDLIEHEEAEKLEVIGDSSKGLDSPSAEWVLDTLEESDLIIPASEVVAPIDKFLEERDPNIILDEAKIAFENRDLTKIKISYKELINRTDFHDSTVEDLKILIDENENDFDLKFLLGDALNKSGNLNEALKLYKDLEKMIK